MPLTQICCRVGPDHLYRACEAVEGKLSVVEHRGVDGPKGITRNTPGRWPR